MRYRIEQLRECEGSQTLLLLVWLQMNTAAWLMDVGCDAMWLQLLQLRECTCGTEKSSERA